MSVEVVTTRKALRNALAGDRPGLVPTMGALHAGHLSLIAQSARENRSTVVSVFVNPTQFGDSTDLARYPRNLAADIRLAADAGATLVFAPDVEAIYPSGFDTWVEVGALSRSWEGASRPDHLRGVATVVTILLNLVQPARAYFGEKDYQQLQVVRRLHRDLALPGAIVGCPTVRDADGLALSSRNERLSPSGRQFARYVPRAINAVLEAAAGGEGDPKRLDEIGRAVLARPEIAINYLAVVDSESLEPPTAESEAARLLVAVEIGGVRLIDNAPLALRKREGNDATRRVEGAIDH